VRAFEACDYLRYARDLGLSAAELGRWLPHCPESSGVEISRNGDAAAALISARQRLDLACQDFALARDLYGKRTWPLLTWRALCEEQAGRPAEAAKLFREALEVNADDRIEDRKQAGAPEDPTLQKDDDGRKYDAREALATASLQRTLPNLAWLSVDVLDPQRGSTTKVDGRPIPESYRGRYYPIDPGRRLLDVEARGYATERRELELKRSDALELRLSLENQGRHESVGIAVAAGGVAAGLVAGYFAARTVQLVDESSSYCREGTPDDVCNPTGVSLRERAKDAQALAAGFAVLGAVGIGTGAYLYW